MKRNIGMTDRIIRVVIFLVLLTLYLANTVTGIRGTVLLAIGVVSLVTAVIGYCGLYHLLGITTLKKSYKKH